MKSLNLNQWKGSNQVIPSFRNIKEKSKCVFIQLDITEFYPLITEKVLEMQFKHHHKSLLHDKILEKEKKLIVALM